MTETEQKDKAFDFEDDRLSKLYRAAATEIPPTTLDDAILAASRKAVRSRPRAAGPFNGRWPLRLALTATLVVAVIILPGLFQQSPKQVSSILDPTLEVAPVFEIAPALDALPQPSVSEPSSAVTSQQEMRIPDQVNHKQPMLKSSQARSKRRTKVPEKRYLLEQAPMAAKQSLGRVRPVVPFKQRNDSTSSSSQSAAGSPRTEAATLTPRVSQGVRFPRAPEDTKLAKNNLSNKEIRLKTIRQLLITGKIDAASELARQFVKDYPDDPLPKDLEFLAVQ